MAVMRNSQPTKTRLLQVMVGTGEEEGVEGRGCVGGIGERDLVATGLSYIPSLLSRTVRRGERYASILQVTDLDGGPKPVSTAWCVLTRERMWLWRSMVVVN